MIATRASLRLPFSPRPRAVVLAKTAIEVRVGAALEELAKGNVPIFRSSSKTGPARQEREVDRQDVAQQDQCGSPLSTLYDCIGFAMPDAGAPIGCAVVGSFGVVQQ
jgi:hypothetical protein